MSSYGYAAAPRGPVDMDEVMRAFPSLRQSLLSKHDDCPLSTLMELRFSRGWNTHPQARGTIFHLFAAKVLRELITQQSTTIPVQVAEAILIEACRQRTDSHGVPIPPEEVVRVPLRQMPELRMAARKFAKDNSFSWQKIVDIEKRMSATLRYVDPNGELRERTLTGQIDALLFDPPDGAIVIDWKDTWGLPPVPRDKGPEAFVGQDDELAGISYHGYFQQRFYGWLVMKNYPNVMRVTLREFYARKTEVRKATLTRDRMEEVEEELAVLVGQFDAAMMQGEPPWPYGEWPAPDGQGRVVDVERMGHWKPSPGRHCGFCAAARHCPIEEDARIEAGGTVWTARKAAALAGELQKIEVIRKRLIEACKVFVETSGSPIPIRDGKGRRVLGWFKAKNGRRFGLYTPSESDRGTHADVDAQLEEAMREATAKAKTDRPPRGRARPGKA